MFLASLDTCKLNVDPPAAGATLATGGGATVPLTPRLEPPWKVLEKGPDMNDEAGAVAPDAVGAADGVAAEDDDDDSGAKVDGWNERLTKEEEPAVEGGCC